MPYTDDLRSDSADVVDSLIDLGLDIRVLTGDSDVYILLLRFLPLSFALINKSSSLYILLCPLYRKPIVDHKAGLWKAWKTRHQCGTCAFSV
jgi:hypothetical protein